MFCANSIPISFAYNCILVVIVFAKLFLKECTAAVLTFFSCNLLPVEIGWPHRIIDDILKKLKKVQILHRLFLKIGLLQ